MTALLFSSFIEFAYGTEAKSEHLGGQALLEKNKKQIELLKAKGDELKKEGGDVREIDDLVALNERLITVNNQRHELHEATKNFAEAVGVFSRNLEDDMAAIDEVIEKMADVAINNAKIAALASPHAANKEKEEHEE